jgi:hypothetical protein
MKEPRAAEPVSASIEVRERRCRICRDATLRILVNELLDWRGVPLILEGGNTHRVTYADILRPLRQAPRQPKNRDHEPLTCGHVSGSCTEPA